MRMDQFIAEKWNKLNKQKILIFCVIFITGIIANLSLLIHQNTNPDGILASEYMPSLLWDVMTGRWATSPIYWLRGSIVLPALTTLFSLVLFTLAILIILDLLRIKGTAFSVITGCVLISFPTITQYLTYFYMSDTFAFSMLAAVGSIWVLEKSSIKRKCLRYPLAVLLLVISMSIYQSMVGVTVCLCMSILMLDIADESLRIQLLLLKLLKFLVYGVVSVAMYFIVANLVCALLHVSLAEYRGINTAFTFSNLHILNMLGTLYRTFFAFYFSDSYYAYTYWGLNVVFGIIFALWIVLEVVWCINHVGKYGLKKAIGRIAVLLALLIIFPIACVAIGILASNTAIDFKMLPQMMLPIATAMSYIGKINIPKKRLAVGLQGGILCLLVIISLRNVTMSNAIAEAMKMKADAAFSLSTRVLMALGENENYSPDTPIAILGNCDDEKWLADTSAYWQLTRADVTLWGQFWSSEYNIFQGSWYQYFRKYHGLSLYMVGEEDALKICNSDEFRDMSIFPSKDSVKMVNGILTVKLSDFE